MEAGTATSTGVSGCLNPFGSDDQLSVRLHQVPVRLMQQGSATLSTTILLNGRVTAHSIGSGQVRLGVDLQVPKTTRQVQQGGEVPIALELPAFHLTSDVLTSPMGALAS